MNICCQLILPLLNNLWYTISMQLVEDALTPACLSADRYTAPKKKGTILMMQDDPHEETQTLVTASHADASDVYVYVFWCDK